eukprot:g5631.t1
MPRGMNRPSFPERTYREETELPGVKQVKESEIGRCVPTNHQFLPTFLRSNPVTSVHFSEHHNSLKWSEGGRFHVYDKNSSNISRTPWNRVRRTVNCMISEIINDQEYLWTGHSTSEVCLWSDTGRLVGKPLVVGKSAITALCLIRPQFVWVGTDSGNIRGLTLRTDVSPFEIIIHTIVVPGLQPSSRTFTSFSLTRPFGMRLRPTHTSIDNIPEDIEVPTMPERSRPSMVEHLRVAAQRLQRPHRAHSSSVRCIYTKGSWIWTSGGRIFSSIKVWCKSDNHFEDSFMCHSRGPCSSMGSIPWLNQDSRSRSSGENWRLLTAHDSGILLLWDPGMRPMRPLLEIETRKSPIRSMVIFESLGLMCTAHKDGSIAFAKLLSPTTQIYGFTGSAAHTEVEDDGQVYPFVPRVICEDIFSCGIQIAIAGFDCLFAVSNRGAIQLFTKQKLQAHVKILQSSSNRRKMPVQAVNESVMVINRSEVEVGEPIYDGDFARVKMGRFLAMDVVVKEAKDEDDSRRAMDALVRDIHILSNVRHPNIVNIMAVCDNPPFVVIQYYEEGSLFDVLKKCRAAEGSIAARKFTWEKRLTVAIDVCCGMVFLHSQRPAIIHRDLKSPNVFVEKDFSGASVGDFNLSKDTGQTLTSGFLNSIRPSNPMWLAPEVARGESDFTIATDLYSFGIIMWELLTARQPWDHLRVNANLSRDNFFSKIRYELLLHHRRPQIRRDEDGKVVLTHSPPSFPQVEAYVKLMEDCWAEEPENRPKSFASVVSRLEEIRRKHRESRTRSGTNPSHSDTSKKSSSETEDKKSKSDACEKNNHQTSKTTNTPTPTTRIQGASSLPPKSPSNLREQSSTGLPRSPFDNNDDTPEEMVDNHYQNQQTPVSPGVPPSPFDLPPESQEAEEEGPLNSPFEMQLNE